LASLARPACAAAPACRCSPAWPDLVALADARVCACA
jgi:hypothetical protein